MGKRLKNYKTGKTYKKRMAGPVHRKIKKWYGMKPFYTDGKIKTIWLKRGKGRAQREFNTHPSGATRRTLRQFTEALNFRNKYTVRD